MTAPFDMFVFAVLAMGVVTSLLVGFSRRSSAAPRRAAQTMSSMTGFDALATAILRHSWGIRVYYYLLPSVFGRSPSATLSWTGDLKTNNNQYKEPWNY